MQLCMLCSVKFVQLAHSISMKRVVVLARKTVHQAYQLKGPLIFGIH